MPFEDIMWATTDEVSFTLFSFILGDDYVAFVIRGSEQKSEEYSSVYYYSKDGWTDYSVEVAPNITSIMCAVAECLETYGYTSSSEAIFDDTRLCWDDKENFNRTMSNLEAEYLPLFWKIYRKYDIDVESIWW